MSTKQKSAGATRAKGWAIARPSVAKARPKREPTVAQAGVRASATPDEHWTRIARVAYFRAEQRGFAPGGELRDWLDAEAEVEAARAGRKRSPVAA